MKLPVIGRAGARERRVLPHHEYISVPAAQPSGIFAAPLLSSPSLHSPSTPARLQIVLLSRRISNVAGNVLARYTYVYIHVYNNNNSVFLVIGVVRTSRCPRPDYIRNGKMKTVYAPPIFRPYVYSKIIISARRVKTISLYFAYTSVFFFSFFFLGHRCRAQPCLQFVTVLLIRRSG